MWISKRLTTHELFKCSSTMTHCNWSAIRALMHINMKWKALGSEDLYTYEPLRRIGIYVYRPSHSNIGSAKHRGNTEHRVVFSDSYVFIIAWTAPEKGSPHCWNSKATRMLRAVLDCSVLSDLVFFERNSDNEQPWERLV